MHSGPQMTETTCCAFHIMTANNEHSLYELEELIKWQREQAKKAWTLRKRGGAPTISCMCVMPYEDILEKNLIKLGFKLIDTMPRRRGYPAGEIREYRLHL